jgi:hypothetical protein
MPIPSTIESLSTTAASNGPAGSEQRTLADDGLRQAYAFIKQLVTLGSNIASASSITPPSTGSSFNITGVTTITGIASTNSWDGRIVNFIFAGVLQLTHSANLALPGSANITTAANDVATFLQTGSGAWRCINYRRAADGEYLPLAGGTVTGNLTVNGNTALGNAVGDTVSMYGSAIVGASGNWTIPAATSGITLDVTGFAGSSPFIARSNEAANRNLEMVNANAAGGAGFAATGLAGTIVGYLQAQASGQVVAGSATSHLFRLQTAGVNRIDIGTAGNVTGNAPSAGVGLTWTGFAGSDVAVLNGGTSGSFRVNTTGVPYATSAHNNAGAVTGTTNQYFCSGTYTPTFAGVTNITGTPSGTAQWTRVGNVVTVSGSVQVDPTTASTASAFTSTLPIASTFGANADLGGTAVRDNNTATNITASIRGSSTLARFDFFCDTNTNSEAWYYTFTYEVL